MKKYYISIIYIFFLSISSFSQVEKIDLGSWYLEELIIDSQSSLVPINYTGEQITTEFTDNGYSGFSLLICDFVGGIINYITDTNSFTTSEVYSSLGGCNIITEGVDFNEIRDNQMSLMSFFTFGEVFNYEILEENLDQPRKLIITASNGDKAIYHFNLLSTSKLRNQLSFNIYPNPVKNQLHISSENNLENYSVKIFDVLGKLKISKKLSYTKTVNVESLSKGMYILSIKDDLENTTFKKFIKN